MPLPSPVPVRAFVLCWLTALPALSVAQPTPPPRPLPFGEHAAAADEAPGAVPSFDLAQRLLRSGQADEAVALLEDLREADPDNVPLWLALRDAYVAARRWDDALRLVESREAATGRSVVWSAERGTLHHRAGRPAAAAEAWAAAVAVAPDAESTYRTVAGQMADLRLFAEAEAVYAAGAERLGDPVRFAVERAQVAGMDGRYEAAAALFLDAAARDPQLIGTVRTALVRLLEADGAPEAFARAADAALARAPTSRPIRYLVGWLALERGDYGRALDATRAIDRLDREEGRGLVAFAQTAEAAGARDEATAALDEALTRYPATPVADEALRLRAALAARRALDAGERAARGPTPFADAARADFDATGVDALAPNALLLYARLVRDVYADHPAAERLYDRARAADDPAVTAEASLALGDVAVRTGDLDAARERFADVEASVRLGPAAEQARFELALLDFYDGLVYSSLARAEAMDENTAADVSNDAIALRVTLQENITEVGADTVSAALTAYAAAALLHRQERDERALAALDSLSAAAPGHPITDELLFLRAQVLVALGQPAEAVATLDRLAAADPTSFFRDRALMVQAETLEERLGDPAGAAARYEQLLTHFPASLFAPEARLRLRRLRTTS